MSDAISAIVSCRGASKGGAVVPSTAHTEAVKVSVGRSQSAPPFGAPSHRRPGAQNVGVLEGAAPPSPGGPVGSAPNLDTEGITQRFVTPSNLLSLLAPRFGGDR